MTKTMWLVRVFHPDHGIRVGVRRDDRVYDVTNWVPTISAWLQSSAGNVSSAIATLAAHADQSLTVFPAALFDHEPAPGVSHWLAPVDQQDIWAAGVIYERSRAARQEEADDGGDVYQRVYNAVRPELFFKARGEWVIGPYGAVGIRSDSTWNVPEPELSLVINPRLEIVGMTVGNDMSSRSIEGENPLYLPQAKIYTASCALGPGILLRPIDDFPHLRIGLEILRQNNVVFSDDTSTEKIRRHAKELLTALGHSLTFPHGVVLMTGTGIVPPSEFTLREDDKVHITIDDIGTLVNKVKVV